MSSVLAHGIADAGELGVPFGLLLAITGGAVVLTGGLLSARDGGRAAPPAERPGVRLPAAVTAVADSAAVRGLLRGLVLVAFMAVLAIAALGPAAPEDNPAPLLVLTGLWGGLVPLSLLAGPVWRVVNPLRALHAGVERLAGGPAGTRPLPARLPEAVATVGLLGIAVLEVVLPPRPTTLLVAVGAYALGHIAAAVVYGPAWFARGESLEVYASLLARLSPWARAADGRLVWRSPRAALAARPVPTALLPAIGVVVALHLTDPILDSIAWQRTTVGLGAGGQLWAGAAVLAAAAAAVTALVRLAARPAWLGTALLPVMAGLGIAHYLVPLLIDGQVVVAQLRAMAGDAPAGVDYEILPAILVALAVLVAIAASHAAGVVVAHDSAVARLDLRTARAAQFGLRVLLVASAVGSVALRFGGW